MTTSTLSSLVLSGATVTLVPGDDGPLFLSWDAAGDAALYYDPSTDLVATYDGHALPVDLTSRLVPVLVRSFSCGTCSGPGRHAMWCPGSAE